MMSRPLRAAASFMLFLSGALVASASQMSEDTVLLKKLYNAEAHEGLAVATQALLTAQVSDPDGPAALVAQRQIDAANADINDTNYLKMIYEVINEYYKHAEDSNGFGAGKLQSIQCRAISYTVMMFLYELGIKVGEENIKLEWEMTGYKNPVPYLCPNGGIGHYALRTPGRCSDDTGIMCEWFPGSYCDETKRCQCGSAWIGGCIVDFQGAYAPDPKRLKMTVREPDFVYIDGSAHYYISEIKEGVFIPDKYIDKFRKGGKRIETAEIDKFRKDGRHFNDFFDFYPHVVVKTKDQNHYFRRFRNQDLFNKLKEKFHPKLKLIADEEVNKWECFA